MKFLIVLVFYVSFLFGSEINSISQGDKPKTSIVMPPYRSEIGGLFLGSCVGLGIGHYYAEAKKSKVPFWFLEDIGVSAISIYLMSRDNKELKAIGGIALFASRFLQGVDAMSEVRKYNYWLYNRVRGPKYMSDKKVLLIPTGEGLIVALNIKF